MGGLNKALGKKFCRFWARDRKKNSQKPSRGKGKTGGTMLHFGGKKSSLHGDSPHWGKRETKMAKGGEMENFEKNFGGPRGGVNRNTGPGKKCKNRPSGKSATKKGFVHRVQEKYGWGERFFF